MKLLIMLLLLLSLFLDKQEGGITFYYGEFEGKNLKCPGYRYEPETGPWLAVDISEYETGRTRCGDLYRIEFYDGSIMYARALDAGYLASANIWDSGLPFVADLPKYWRDGRETRTGSIVNLSQVDQCLFKFCVE